MNSEPDIFSTLLLQIGRSVMANGAFTLIALLSGLGLMVLTLQHRKNQRLVSARAAQQQAQQLSAMMAAQEQMQGRMATLADVFSARQGELNQAIGSRLDMMSGHLHKTMNVQTKSTHDNLTKLQERLAVIDRAQNNIQSLSSKVVELQSILSNKQTRGAFGQARMETIISDALPQGAYNFQPTLSNNTRPDCTVNMPNGAPCLVIDAKFPLEAWNAIRQADNENDERTARQRFRRDIEVHLNDIAKKYLLTGETQETAFMFVPSESVFAEIHEHFESLVQKAHRLRVVIVSPTLLTLSIQVIQAILKDVRMQEEAHLIQKEVALLMEDMSRLDGRVRKLHSHFQQANRDVDEILISTEKLTKRGAKMANLEFSTPSPAPFQTANTQETQNPANLAQTRLRLRVVDDE